MILITKKKPQYVQATKLKDGTPAPPGIIKTKNGHAVKRPEKKK